jgi:hypothetical protein
MLELLPMNAGRSPARALPPRLLFGAGASVTLVAVLLLGWLTNLRSVIHALLITLGAHALIPFLLVMGVIALVSGAALTTALMVEDSGASPAALDAALGGRLGRAYYEQIRRQRRHPLAWGLGVGFGLGVVGVCLVLAALVVPLETRTLSVLLLAEARIDAGRRGDLPAAAPSQPRAPADGLLYPTAWNAPPAGANASPVLDAFGHAVAYRMDEASSDAGYTLRSLGLDGVPSDDDLCVSGQATHTDAAHDPLQFLEDLRADRLGWSTQVEALARARCNASAR